MPYLNIDLVTFKKLSISPYLMVSALITGITGQDGSYLAEFLLNKGYEVYGMYRRSSVEVFERIDPIKDKINLICADLTDQSSLNKTIKDIKPDEVYNLAAQSFVPASWTQPILTGEVTALGVTRLLEAIRHTNSKIKFYQASSSEMFGKVQETPQTEKTPFYPRSPYGVSKIYGHWISRNYRESYGMFAVNGILFNHESPRRGENFVTRKITNGLVKIKRGEREKLYLGNLHSKRDWGYAKDYVEGMWLILQQDNPDDYILATNETHSVREFVEEACKLLDFDLIWEGEGLNEKGIDKKTKKAIIEIDPMYMRPAEVDLLIGDYSKAQDKLKWEPKVKFKELVKIMVEAELNGDVVR